MLTPAWAHLNRGHLCFIMQRLAQKRDRAVAAKQIAFGQGFVPARAVVKQRIQMRAALAVFLHKPDLVAPERSEFFVNNLSNRVNH